MTYQETLSLISSINDELNTKNLTREETKELIIRRELLWDSYKKN